MLASMRKILVALSVPALVATAPLQAATATTLECTPRAGTEPWYFSPGFAMLGDGRIVLGGVSSYNGEPSTAGVVLTADGDIDLNLSTAIAPLTIAQRQADILVEPNGDIVMVGGFDVLDSTNTKVSQYVARFDGSTGEIDSTLIGNLGADSITTSAFSVARQSDGRLIVGGPTEVNGTIWPRLGRVTADGSADTDTPTFATNVPTLNGHPYDIAVRSDDRVWVGGAFTGGVRLLESDGTPITVGTTDQSVRVVMNRPGDSVLLGGHFTTFTAPPSPAAPANHLVALNSDGTPDTTFNANMGSGANGPVRSLATQADGKILVGGDFTEFDGVPVDGVARLNADGTPDTTFNTSVSTQDIYGARAYPGVHHVGVQPDGRVVVFGYLEPVDPVHGTLSPGVARLSADGVLDVQFNADCVAAASSPPPPPPPTVPVSTVAPTTTVVSTTVVSTTTSTPPTSTTVVLTNDDLPDADTLAGATPTDFGAPSTIPSGSTVTLTGTGFTPQENVVVLLASRRQIVSQVEADSTGTASAEFTPEPELGGEQTIVMWEPKSGTMKAQNITVVAGSLPATGRTNWVPWSLLVVAIGALVLGVRRYSV